VFNTCSARRGPWLAKTWPSRGHTWRASRPRRRWGEGGRCEPTVDLSLSPWEDRARTWRETRCPDPIFSRISMKVLRVRASVSPGRLTQILELNSSKFLPENPFYYHWTVKIMYFRTINSAGITSFELTICIAETDLNYNINLIVR